MCIKQSGSFFYIYLCIHMYKYKYIVQKYMYSEIIHNLLIQQDLSLSQFL